MWFHDPVLKFLASIWQRLGLGDERGEKMHQTVDYLPKNGHLRPTT